MSSDLWFNKKKKSDIIWFCVVYWKYSQKNNIVIFTACIQLKYFSFACLWIFMPHIFMSESNTTNILIQIHKN